jgi:PmbA protein
MNKDTDDRLNLLKDLVAKAKRAGADEAEAVAIDGTALSVSWRLGKTESLEQADAADLGLRVFVGKKQASVASTDRRASTLEDLVARAVAMARVAPEDPYCGLAAPDEIARAFPSLELADDFDLLPEVLLARAREAEDAARAVPGVTLVDSTSASAGNTTILMTASNGFSGSYRRTSYGIGASVIAGSDTEMVTDYDFASRVFQSDLPDASLIGRRAGERTVKQLKQRKMPSAQVPVVFDPREASGLLHNFASAVSGASIARGTSFLKDYLGKAVFADAITIIDDPFRQRGLRSRLFDGEGIMPKRMAIVEKGVLKSWFLDLRSARQLGLQTTGHAGRGVGGPPSPSPSNLYIEAGSSTPADLIKDIKQGFYVTALMGMGVNGVTGDYSQAASGFWIEDGVLAFPVNEMTIAGNMRDMFRHIAAGSDLAFEYGFDSPTLRVEEMTVAGV